MFQISKDKDNTKRRCNDTYIFGRSGQPKAIRLSRPTWPCGKWLLPPLHPTLYINYELM